MPAESRKDLKGSGSALGVAHKKGQKKKKSHVSVRGQMRSLQRLLNKIGPNPKVLKGEEAKLEVLRQKHEQNKQNQKDKQLATRYHMAKFFERVKIDRLIQQAKREVAKKELTKEQQDTAAAKLVQLEEDLQYVMHFPKGEKFVSLLKNADTPEAQAKLEEERARLRGLVRRQMADNMLLSEANEGRRETPVADSIVQEGPDVRVAAQKPHISKTKKEPSLPSRKGKEAAPASRIKLPGSTMEAATAVAPRSAEGNMAEEDDFFMQSGDEGAATGKARDVEQQMPSQVRPRPGIQLVTPPKKPGALSKHKAAKTEREPSKIKRSHESKIKHLQIKPQVEKPTRTRAEGGRKRRKKANN